MPGLRSNLFALDPEPESKPAHERRRGPYSRRNAGLYRAVDLPTFLGAILLPVLIACAVGMMTGCVTTELTSAGVTISRTSVLSDVELEASISPEGRMSIRERQGQAVAEGIAGALPGVGR